MKTNNKKGAEMFSILWLTRKSIKTGGNLKMTLKTLGVNTRKGEFNKNKITWTRYLARPLEIRVSKTDKTYASVGYETKVSWIMSTKKNIAFSKGAVIGLTVSRAKGKKGGWCVNLHNQKVVLSETHNKFVFCNYWTHYWFSEQMFCSGLWASMDKKAKAEKVPSTFRSDINEAILMVHDAEKQTRTSDQTQKENF